MTRARDLANIADGTFTATDLNLSGTLDVSGDATFDTNTLFVDVSTNRVGVGTTSPSRTVSIVNNAVQTDLSIVSSTSGLSIIHFGDTEADNKGQIVYRNSTDNLEFYVNSAERMRIDSSGNVGIGCTPSPWGFSKALQLGDGASLATSGNQNMWLSSNLYLGTDANFKYVTSRKASQINLYDGEVSFKRAATGTAGATATLQESMRIDSSGNVGIGTSSPTAINSGKVVEIKNSGTANTVADNQDLVIASDNRYAVLTIKAKNDKGSLLYFGDGDNNSIGSLQYDHTNNYLATFVNGSEAMRIDSSGNVGIGTSSPAQKLDVTGNLRVKNGAVGYILGPTGEMLIGEDGGALYIGLGFGANPAIPIKLGSPGTTQIEFSSGGSERMRITSGGNVGIGTTSPGANLEVFGSGSSELRIRSTGASAPTTLSFWARSSSNTSVYVSEISGLNSGGLAFRTTGAINSTPTEAMRIDSSGRLLVGKTSSSFSNEGSELRSDGQIIGTKDGGNILTLNRLTSDGNLAGFYKDDTLVGLIGSFSDRLFIAGASNRGGLRFDASGSNLVLPCNSDGSNSDNDTDLGYSSARFDDIFATNGTIQTSDANEKQDIEELDEAERRVAVAAKGLLRKFRWISSVEKKGDDARIHFGIIAQDLQAAFEAEGLDAGRYAMFIHSTWTDEETGEERSRMGVRYSELLAFIIAAL